MEITEQEAVTVDNNTQKPEAVSLLNKQQNLANGVTHNEQETVQSKLFSIGSYIMAKYQDNYH